MSTPLRLASLLSLPLVAAGLAACGGDDDDSADGDGGPIHEIDAQPAPVLPNNGAVLDGDDAAGQGTLTRKQLTIEDASTDAPVAIDEVWAIAGSPGYVRFLFHFTNTSNAEHCLVQAGGISYLDQGGTAIGEPTGVFVVGSVREGSGVFTSTCLAVGESAWGIDIRSTDTPLDDFAGVRFTLSVGFGDYTTPTTTLLPTSYGFSGGGIDVAATNSGVLPLTADFNLWVPLDADGAPLTWGLLDPDTVPVPVGPSSFSAVAIYGGTAAKVDIRFEFAEDAPPAVAARALSQRVMAARDRLRALDQAARAAR